MEIIFFHSPNCGTSKHALQLVYDAGYSPTVIDYVKTGWSKPQLQMLFAAAGITAREALRVFRTNAEEMGLTDPAVSEETLINAMLADPILVNRPFVVCKNGTALCNPSSKVLDLLDHWPKGPYHAKDGSLLINENGERV